MHRSLLIFPILAGVFIADSYGQTVSSIDIRQPYPEVLQNHLHLGDSNPQGESFSFNSLYMEHNGQPVLPVMGEFHYVRTPETEWDDSLKKMKAAGISIISTYVFWNIHEEVEGQFDWSGSKDLRHFVELCRQNGLPVIVRVGPFCHGEIRNGGLPDWLYGRPFNVRSNDPAYLRYVEQLYSEIGKQLAGLLFKDGGPVIGFQIENEYHHSAAHMGVFLLWSAAGMDQCRRKSLFSIGFQRPSARFLCRRRPQAHENFAGAGAQVRA